MYSWAYFILRQFTAHATVSRPNQNYTTSPKSIPDIFDCNLKTNYQILIIFGMNILNTTCRQMTF